MKMYIQKAVLQIRIQIQCFSDPWIRYPDPGRKKIQSQDPGNGLNIPVQFFGLKILILWCQTGCGAGSDPDPNIDPDP